MKRVLQVFEPGVDGVFRHVEGLVDFLISQESLIVGIAYSSIRSSEGLFALIDRVKASGGAAMDLETGNAPSPRDFRSLRQLRRLIKEFKPFPSESSGPPKSFNHRPGERRAWKKFRHPTATVPEPIPKPGPTWALLIRIRWVWNGSAW